MSKKDMNSIKVVGVFEDEVTEAANYIRSEVDKVAKEIEEMDDDDEMGILTKGNLMVTLIAYATCFSEIIPRIGNGEKPMDIAKDLVHTNTELYSLIDKVTSYGR